MYIDVEKLKEKIHPHYENAKKRAHYAAETGTSSDCVRWDEAKSTYEFILYLIDSLQQEQSESDIEKEIDEYIEKEFGERWDGCVPVSCFDLVIMANHFYERGMSVMRERITNPDYNQKVVEKMKSEYPMDESNARKEE